MTRKENPVAEQLAPGPAAGQLTRFDRDALGLISDLRQRYGGISRIKLGPYTVHLISDPAHVKYVLQDNAHNYVRGRFYRNFTLFFGNGMLTTDGPDWRGRRQVSQPFFHRPVLKAKSPMITDRANALLAQWQEAADRGEAVDATDGLMRLAIDVFGRMFLGTDLSRYSAELIPAVIFAMQAVLRSGSVYHLLPRWIPTRYQRTLRKHQRTLDGVMNEIVERCQRGEIDQDTVVGALLAAKDDDGNPWPRDKILAEMKTLFLAGHETSGCSMIWTLYAIARHPDVRRRLETELDSVLAGRTPTAADLPDLPYLRQVVDESLRLYPPDWSYPRDVVADDTIGGYHIPAGSSVILSSYVTHHDRELWENPEALDPERFCPHAASKQDKQRPRYAYVPFGGGARKCIGFEAALLEIQLTVATIAQRLRLDTLPAAGVEPWPKASLRPVPNLMMFPTRRPS
jgi:cytochrome P450